MKICTTVSGWVLIAAAALSTAAGFPQTSGQPSQGQRTAPAVRGMPSAEELAEGKALYEEHCAICHYSDSTAKKIAAGLKGIYARPTYADGRRVNDTTMTAWIENGGKDMPGFKEKLRPAQVRALIAYLRSL